MHPIITLSGEWSGEPFVKVWIDRTGKVSFSPLKKKEEGWNFMASMKVHGELARTLVEQRLKKRFKRLLEKGISIPKAKISKETVLLAKRLDKQSFTLGNEVMVANISDQYLQDVL